MSLRILLVGLITAGLAGSPAPGARAEPAPAPNLAPLPSLELQSYLGQWHQLALYPNRFQRQCVAQTTATYARRDDGRLSVVNRCRTAAGRFDEVVGVAEPRDGARLVAGRLEPASLRVSFLPSWLRWLPVGWGRYDVLARLHDERIAIVSEPSREYLWVLSRDARIPAQRWREVQAWLQQAGFELARLQVDADAVLAP